MVAVSTRKGIVFVCASDVTVTINTNLQIAVVFAQFWFFNQLFMIFYSFLFLHTKVLFKLVANIPANVSSDLNNLGHRNRVYCHTCEQSQVQKLFLVVFKIFFLKMGLKNEFFDACFVLGFGNMSVELAFILDPLLNVLQILLILDLHCFLLLGLADLGHKFYLFQQNLALFKCLLYLFLLILIQIFLFFRERRFMGGLKSGELLILLAHNLSFVERRHALLRSKRLLRFSLYFLDGILGEFILMLLEMQVELFLSLEVVVADVALDQAADSNWLPHFYLSD